MDVTLLQIEAKESSAVKCGGTLYRVAMPQSYEEIVTLCHKYYGEDMIVVGGLTNTLVLSGGENKLCISTKMLKGATVENDTIEAYSGESLAKVAQLAQFYCLSGMENISNIPGSIGGAVFGNSGCFGSSISDIVESVKIINLETGNMEVLQKEEIGFFYRYTNLRKNRDFIYSVKLKLMPYKCNEIALRMNEIKKVRQLQQPNKPSIGSVFKKLDNVSAGYYIEKAGLKGWEHNGMEYSNMHANFIVNNGGSAEDYLYLMELGEKTVFEKFGKKLVREVNVIGEPTDKEFDRE